VIPRKQGAPVLKNPQKISLGNVRLRHVFGHVGKTKASQCSLRALPDRVEDELSIYAHMKLTFSLLKFPRI